MFLDMLKNNREKESFMELAYWVATADGGLGLPEMKMMDMFSNETGIGNWRKNGALPMRPQSSCVFADELSRKIAFSNLLAIGYSEEYENSSQTKVIETIRDQLSISPEVAQSYRDWMKMVKGSYLPRYYMD